MTTNISNQGSRSRLGHVAKVPVAARALMCPQSSFPTWAMCGVRALLGIRQYRRMMPGGFGGEEAGVDVRGNGQPWSGP